jgi:hypothetical protein
MSKSQYRSSYGYYTSIYQLWVIKSLVFDFGICASAQYISLCRYRKIPKEKYSPEKYVISQKIPMNVTPAMQQYYDIKEQYPDTILFFRMGDFYEMFHEDAQIAHSVLGIALTTRNKNAPDPIPLAGIPYHAKERYL